MKNPETLHMICARAEEALEQIAREADMRKPADAEQVKNLLSIAQKAETLMETAAGYSGAMTPAGGMYAGGYGYSGAYPGYDQGSSYRRHRDSMGRYASQGNYSQGGYAGQGYARTSMEDHLAAMEAEAATPAERQKIAAMRQIMTAG